MNATVCVIVLSLNPRLG